MVFDPLNSWTVQAPWSYGEPVTEDQVAARLGVSDAAVEAEIEPSVAAYANESAAVLENAAESGNGSIVDVPAPTGTPTDV